jgi:hypothetical protein
MQLHATASTTIGELVLFWPELLPADFDAQFHEPAAGDSSGLVDTLREAGTIVLLTTGEKGEYHLAVLVDEPLPAAIENQATLIGKVETLQVVAAGWFAGVECLFRDDRWLLQKYPRMGTAVQLPPGVYSAELFATELPDAVYETWLHDQAGSRAVHWWWLQTWLASLGVVAFLIFVVCLFFATRQTMLITLAVATLLLTPAWLMSRTTGYARVQQARREYHQAYPDFVVRLRNGSATSYHT